MAFSYPPASEIQYSPSDLASFHCDGYEWIDHLNFVKDADVYLLGHPYKNEFLSEAKRLFTEAGWDGDGKNGVIWLPPFLFGQFGHTKGVILWHVKQLEDGISWILSPIELPYESIALTQEQGDLLYRLHGKPSM